MGFYEGIIPAFIAGFFAVGRHLVLRRLPRLACWHPSSSATMYSA
jgi:hypothetical protein